MAKFIFLQPYTIRTSTIVKSFNTGDIIEGVKKSQPAGIPNAPANVFIETVVNGQSFPIADFLVKEHTGASSPPDNSTPFVWTPIKKVFASVFAISVFLGILKIVKVI